MKDSPGKAGKIRISYIENLPDVTPQPPTKQVSLATLMEMGKTLDKAELWMKSDLRLIFSVKEKSRVKPLMDKINAIIVAKEQLNSRRPHTPEL